MRGRSWFAVIGPAVLAGLALAFALGWLLAPRGGCHPQVSQSAEERTLQLVNEYRVQNGLPALRVDVRLDAAADWMASDMATFHYLSHTDSQGRDPFARMAAFGYPVSASWTGENLARGSTDPAQLVDLWRASPEHNANLLGPHFTEAGIGFNDGYAAMDYGSSAAAQTALPTPAPTPESQPMPTETPCR